MSASLQCWVSVTNNRASRPSQFSDKLIFSWPCLLPAACCLLPGELLRTSVQRMGYCGWFVGKLIVMEVFLK